MVCALDRKVLHQFHKVFLFLCYIWIYPVTFWAKSLRLFSLWSSFCTESSLCSVTSRLLQSLLRLCQVCSPAVMTGSKGQEQRWGCAWVLNTPHVSSYTGVHGAQIDPRAVLTRKAPWHMVRLKAQTMFCFRNCSISALCGRTILLQCRASTKLFLYLLILQLYRHMSESIWHL